MRHLLFVLLCCPLLMGAASRSFDGTNDVISMGNTNVVTTGDVTVSLWVKTTEDATTDFFIGKKRGICRRVESLMVPCLPVVEVAQRTWTGRGTMSPWSGMGRAMWRRTMSMRSRKTAGRRPRGH